jgi:hypothetical protein
VAGSVHPWVTAETTTAKKTPSNSPSAFGRPLRSGYVARMMGTAPLSPPHATKVISRGENRNGSRHDHTARGRAMNTSVPATTSAGPATSMRRLGKLRRPRSTNIMICAIHASPSWNK